MLISVTSQRRGIEFFVLHAPPILVRQTPSYNPRPSVREFKESLKVEDSVLSEANQR